MKAYTLDMMAGRHEAGMLHGVTYCIRPAAGTREYPGRRSVSVLAGSSGGANRDR